MKIISILLLDFNWIKLLIICIKYVFNNVKKIINEVFKGSIYKVLNYDMSGKDIFVDILMWVLYMFLKVLVS